MEALHQFPHPPHLETRLVTLAVLSLMQEATLGPAWTYNKEVEAPAAEKDMGGWTMGVYTQEQQTRLNVNELGEQV